MADFVFQARKSFFDSEKVLKTLDKAERRAVSKMGAYVWRRSKSSLKYSTKSAAPGAPPIVHRSSGFTRKKTNKKTGETTQQASSPLRELIFFAWNESSRSVFVGPVPFRGPARVPGILEQGGTSVIRQADGSSKVGHYRARPYMRPALEAEAPKFADQMRNILNK